MSDIKSRLIVQCVLTNSCKFSFYSCNMCVMKAERTMRYAFFVAFTLVEIGLS